MDDLLDFSFNVPRLLVKDLDPLPVDLMVGCGLVFPDCGCCLFLRVFDQSLLQSPRCLSYAVLSTAVACHVDHARFFSGEVLSVGRTNWGLKVLQDLLQMLVPCDLKTLLRCSESPDT